MDNPGEWCTYVQASQRLHKSIGAIRQMALRGKLQRVHGNDGKALVFVADEHARAADVQTERAAHEQRHDSALMDALREHNVALESHIKTLQGDNEALKEQLAAERERADKAIAAFANLADRLDALAAVRARPWWKRLVG